MRRLLVLPVLLSALPSLASADDVAARLPADTLVYVELARLQELPDRVQGLPVWTEGPWIGEAVEKLEEMLFGALVENEEMRIEREKAVAVLETCDSVHAALLSIEVKEREGRGTQETVRGIAVLSLTNPAPALALVANELKEIFSRGTAHGNHTIYDLSDDDDLVVQCAFAGNSFVLATGEEVLAGYLDALDKAPEESLASNPGFARVKGEFGSAPLWGYANIAGFVDFARSTLGFEDRTRFDKFDAMVMLSDWEVAGFSSNFETAPGEAATRLRVYHQRENPLATLVSSQPLDPEFLKFVPASSVFALGTSFADAGAKWKDVRAFVERVEREVVEDDDFARELAQMKERGGIDLDEAFGLVDGQAIVFVPAIEGEIDDDFFTFAFRVKDPAAAKAFFERAKTTGTHAKLWVENGELRTETYRGNSIEYRSVEGRDGEGYALVGNHVLVSGDPRALRLAIDSWSGEADSILSRYGTSLASFVSRHAKILVLAPSTLLGEERETTLAATRIRADWPLAVGTIETAETLDLEANASVFSVLATVGLGTFLWEETSADRAACQERLGAIAAALQEYQTKNGKWPATLPEALPEGAGPEFFRCPLEAAGATSTGPSYDYFPPVKQWEEAGWRSLILAHCRHAEHGRVVLQFYGSDSRTNVSTIPENRFRRYLASTKEAIAAAAKEDGQEDGK